MIKAGLRLIISMCIFALACKQSPYQEGERVYQAYCQNCHMEDGKGLGTLIPPLVGADYYQKNLENLPCIIKYGIVDTITVNGIAYNQGMAGIPNISNIQMANLINYMNNRWYPDQPLVNYNQVKKALELCKE